jgi:hypothetical protein
VVLLLVGVQFASARRVSAQTLVQIQQLGSNIGPRLTQAVTQLRLGVSLFGAIAGKVTYVDALGSSPTAYYFTSDRMWDRVLFGRKDDYINEFSNANSPFGRLAEPKGLDVSPLSLLFVADSRRQRIVIARFDAPTRTITTLGYAGGVLVMPVDVAWDGRAGPFADDAFFYVADEAGRISYWHWLSGVPYLFWQYGARGVGVGQFGRPTGVCAGHALGANGGTVFTTDFYVADAGTGRLIWLRRNDGTNQVTWMASATLDAGGAPIDCTVDHFGNVYVADEQNSRILKYTSSLELLATYGSYGRGATNFNTFSHPHAIHAVFGVRPAGTWRVWYGEGRIITAEDWTSTSGAVEHWLGVDIPYTGVFAGFGAILDFRTTDHAYVTVEVLRDATLGTIRILTDGSGFRPPGFQSVSWDGNLGDGTAAPGDWYRFRITAVSGYGCDGSSWCRGGRLSDRFWARGRDCSVIECPEARRVGVLPGLLDPSERVPSSFFLHQVVSMYVGPLARRAALSADLRGERGATSVPGALSAQVRAQGLMALAVGVPSSSTPTPVTVRVYSLSGVLVRELVREAVEPGDYVVGWGGTDRDGRRAPPGVYVAVMTSGSFRGMQRLIVARR